MIYNSYFSLRHHYFQNILSICLSSITINRVCTLYYIHSHHFPNILILSASYLLLPSSHLKTLNFFPFTFQYYSVTISLSFSIVTTLNILPFSFSFQYYSVTISLTNQHLQETSVSQDLRTTIPKFGNSSLNSTSFLNYRMTP